ERLAVIPELRPQVATFSLGSGALLGRPNKDGKGWAKDKYVPLFQSYAEMEKTAALMREYGTRPEIEIYHAGMLSNLAAFDRIGAFDNPLMVNFVMGIPGEITPAEITDLQYVIGKLPKGANWLVTGIGAKNHFRIMTAAVLLGGHVRVGMEDNVYAAPGELATSNAQLVEKAVRILDELAVPIASPAEARKILVVKES
ncbi:MAG: 3-keto-5-aminohexanoate cleavage protein, partial [Paracoccaceae bacterium]